MDSRGWTTKRVVGWLLGLILVAAASAALVQVVDGWVHPSDRSRHEVPPGAVRTTGGHGLIHGYRFDVQSALVTQNQLGETVIRLTDYPQTCADRDRAYIYDLRSIEIAVADTPQGVGDLPLNRAIAGNRLGGYPQIDYTWFPGGNHVNSALEPAEVVLTAIGTDPGDYWYGHVRSLSGSTDIRSSKVHADFGAEWCGL